jgi:predicted RNA-binding protein YlxR (DUF448 family)
MIGESRHSEQGSELDRGPQARERERLCVATRTVRPISELLRFVIGPDREVVPDIKCKLPGRGVWVTATRAAIADAVNRRAFARGFKGDVRSPEDLAGRTERLLERAAIEALAIAGKAGLARSGFAKAATALERNEAVALLHAAEASPEGVRKLNALIHRQGRPVAVLEFLTSAQLDLALGRPNVVHAAVLAGPVSGTFLSRALRLERYRTGGAGDRGNQVGRTASH